MSLLETKRLLIQPVKMDDSESIGSILKDADAMFYIGGFRNQAQVEMQMLHWLNDYKTDGYGFMTMKTRSNNETVGYAGFVHHLIEGRRVLELGYVVARSFWGHGYATEAAAALKEYGLQTLHLPELFSVIHEENKASIRVAEKIGMTFHKKLTIDDKPCLIYHT